MRKILCQVILIHNTLLLLQWTILIMQARTAYQEWNTLMIHDTALTVFQVKPKTWKPKPTTTSIDIPGIKSPDKLKCQEIKKCVLTKATIGEVFFSRGRVVYKLRNSQQFFYCKVYSGLLSKSFIWLKENYNDIITWWTGIRALILSAKVPEVHVDFLLFIPKPVTEYSTIYASMLNFVKVSNQLD